MAAARVAYIDGDYVLQPTISDMENSDLDLVVAGTARRRDDGRESEAKELSEDIMLGAVAAAHEGFQPVIDAIIDLAEKAAKEPWDFTAPDYYGREKSRYETCSKKTSRRLTRKLTKWSAKLRLQTPALKALKLLASDDNPDGMSGNVFGGCFKSVESSVVRSRQ